MINNEMWLAHSDLLSKYWVVEKMPWVKTLGWFDEFSDILNDHSGWNLFGNTDVALNEYLDLIYPVESSSKLYCRKNGQWEHLTGPIVFVYRKSSNEVYIAGWAGDPMVIQELKAESSDPWSWKNIVLVDVDPVAAVRNAAKSPDKNHPVFFMSNGETNADINWTRLKSVCPRAVRVDGIHGRRAAFHHCAERTTNSHFFVVTGKNWVTVPEVFEYIPNIQEIGHKHSVFFSKNMSNDWIGGHMGIVLYNRDTVLNTPEDFGLDFTEYGGTVQIPILASNAMFATTPFEAWRTAFREAVKLKVKSFGQDEFAQKNLSRWLSYAVGEHKEWVIAGATAGSEYASMNWKEDDILRNTVDWKWLRSYFEEFGQLKIV